MRDETRDARTHEQTFDGSPCARGEELVAYVYGEADEGEAGRFRQHLTTCAACRDELSAFAGVRESVGAWRAELFGVSPAASLEHAATAAGEFSHSTSSLCTPARPTGRRRSAVAALRECFALSPRWLQAAGVAAAVAFCALAALTLTRAEVRWDSQGFALRAVPARVVPETVRVPADDSATRAELDALAAENTRIKAELETLRSRPSQAALVSAASPDERPGPRRASASDATTRQDQRRRTPRRAPQFARYEDEDGLPRLSDLLDEVN